MQELQKLLEAQPACLPQLGSDIADLAEHHGLTTEVVIRNLLFSNNLPLISLTVAPGSKSNFKWLIGHSLSPTTLDDYGPRRKYRAMIVNKCAHRQDVNLKHFMSSPAFRTYKEYLKAAGLEPAEARDVYVTGLLKTTALKVGKSFSKKWVKQQDIFLVLEILLTQPDVILMLGKEVCDFFVPKMKVSSGEGRWHDYRLDTTSNLIGTIGSFSCKVLAAPSPGIMEVETTPESVRRLATSAKDFVGGLKSVNSGSAVSVVESRQYEVVNNIDELVKLFNKIVTELNHRKLVSVDAEWQGRSPQNKGSFIRCIQFGWDYGKAATIKLTDTEGRQTFSRSEGSQPDIRDKYLMYGIIEEYFRLFNLRPAGFFFQSDNEWLSYDGLDLLQFFTCPDSPEKCKDEGGFGLDLAVLAYDELMSNELEMIRRFFTDVPDYYSKFDKARVELGKSVSSTVYDSGFGWIPDDVLLQYAGGDADVQVSASLRFCDKLLDKDAFGNSLWLPFWHSTMAVPAACEIMRSGMPFNKQQALKLAKVYAKAVNKYMRKLEEAFNWPDFPIDTWQQLSTALYGPRYSGYVDKLGVREDRRPPGAKSLMLEPVIDNGQPPVDWKKVKSLGKEKETNPSSGLKALAMMRYSEKVEMLVVSDDGAESIVSVPPPPELKLLADTKVLRQVQKNFLGSFDRVIPGDKLHKLPTVYTGYDPVAGFAWTGGYPQLVSDDDYLRCFISTVKETARWSASSPNLHNSPNKAEGVYEKILGKEEYPGFIRTAFQAPEDFAIVETDLASAELFMLAMASGDAVLWDHCMRNLLEETDPRFIDPHASLCVKSFNLSCEPTKAGLKSIGMEYIRNVGKCIAAGEYLWTDRGPLLVEHLLANHNDDVDVDLEPKAVSLNGYTPIEVVERSEVKECLTLVNNLGGELTVSADHRSFVIEPDGSVVVKEAQHTEVGDQLLVNSSPVNWAADGTVPLLVREAVSSLFLPGYMYGSTTIDSESFSRQGCFLLGLIVSQAKKHSSQEITLSVVEDCRDPEAAKTILSVASLLSKAVVPRLDVVVDGKTGIISIKGPKVSESLDKLRSQWPTIPNFVLRLSWGRRLAYASGLSIGRVRGVRQGVCVLVDESIVRRYRMLLQSCGIMVKPRRAGENGDVIPMDAISVVDHESLSLFRHCMDDVTLLKNRKTVDHVFSRFYDRLSDEMVEGERVGIASKLGYTFKSKGYRRSELISMVNEIVQFVTTKQVSLSEDDFDFLELAGLVLNSPRLMVTTVVAIRKAGNIQCYDVQTTSEQGHALIGGDGIVTHNSVLYGWAYGRQAEAIVMGAKELGITVTVEEARKLLEFLPKQYVNGGMYLEEAASCVDKGFLTMPMGRIRRAPQTGDRAKRSAYMREFKNAPIQGGVADVINKIASNLVWLRKKLQMRFHIILQMHDAFYFLVHKSEIMKLCTEVIPKAIVDMTPIVPFTLSGVRSRAEPKYMGFNIAIMRAWKEKVGKEAYKEWLLSMGVDYKKIPRLEI